MDIWLNKEKMNTIKNVLSTNLKHEETMEMIVPDALPDILRIVDTDANVFLRSKATDNGRVSVTGVAEATVLYAPEGEDGLRKMTAELPFTVSANAPEIDQNTRVTSVVNIENANASMINPRKIVVRVNLLSDIGCFNDAELTVASGLEDSGDNGIELKTDAGDIFTTTSVREKTFVVADELNIPASNPPVGELLKYRVSLIPDETKVVGSKLILRGTANASLMYLPSGGGDVTKSDLSNEFSQIMELDNIPAEGTYHLMIMLTNASFDCDQSSHNPDGRTVLMEVHAVAQCVASEKKRLNYISDLYSTKYKLDQQTADYAYDSRSTSKTNGVFHGVLETPGGISRVVALNVHPGAAEVTEGERNQTLRAPVNVSAMYLSDDNQLMNASGQFAAEANTDISPNAKMSISANCGKDVYGVPVGNGIELRIPVEFSVTETAENQLRTLTSLNCDETAPIDNSKAPTIIVARANKEDTLWKLAKKHNSSSKLILDANELDKEENITPGQLLIIPKKR